MIDLHLHLDGSLSIEDFQYLSKLNNIPLGSDFPNNIVVPDDCPSLDDYLKRFDLPCSLLQNEESLRYVARSLVIRLYKLGLVYAEIRYAPQLHTLKGLNQYQVAKAVLKGVNEGLQETPGFEANIILCCMRHASVEVNMETVETAIRLKGTRVVAIDLAGGETIHPCNYFKQCFDKARENGINITIHAGESTGHDEVCMAFDMGATRIGHGVHYNSEFYNSEKIAENKCFEFCPTSNLQTKSLKTYNDVPIRQFLSKGLNVTINSDNMTCSHTDVNKEWSIMVKTFNLTKEEVKEMLLNSVTYSFTDSLTKASLKEKVLDKLDSYFIEISK